MSDRDELCGIFLVDAERKEEPLLASGVLDGLRLSLSLIALVEGVVGVVLPDSGMCSIVYWSCCYTNTPHKEPGTQGRTSEDGR